MQNRPQQVMAHLPTQDDYSHLRARLYIGGEWRTARDSQVFPVYNPSSGEQVEIVANASEEDGVAAVDAASEASSGWAQTSPRSRGEILRRIFDLMIENKEYLARLITRENGKALVDSRNEVLYAAEFFRWYSEEAVRCIGEISVAPAGTHRIMVIRQPVGISVLIAPWNFPAAMATRKIAPALAAGCTVILKPASETPLTSLALMPLLERAGVPPGVVNVLPTRRTSGVVSTLLNDPRVRKVSFTGSTEVGRKLLSLSSNRILNCSMELGGNAPFIVFADADIREAVAGAVLAKMRNGGEACTAANRFYVERPIADLFARDLGRAMAALRVGDGFEDGIELGPLINSQAKKKIEELVNDAITRGARVTTGGVSQSSRGNFYEPTVLFDVKCGSRILQEEIFGPVAPIVIFDTLAEVIDLANATDYGLASYVFTRDLAKGLAVAERIECGMVALNRGLLSDPAAPFGGMKQSGIGREGSNVGMLEFLETKYVALSW